MTEHCNGCIWADQCINYRPCEDYDPVSQEFTEEALV